MADKIFFVQYEVTPEKGTELADAYGGALISAWIWANSVNNAKAVFERSLKDTGWKIFQFEEAYTVDKKRYAPGDEALEFYQQALEERDDVFYIDAWPPDDAQP